jgi:hypothetical protein
MIKFVIGVLSLILVSCGPLPHSIGSEAVVVTDQEFQNIILDGEVHSSLFVNIWTINNSTKSRYILQLDEKAINIARLSYDNSIDYLQVSEYPSFSNFIKNLSEWPQSDTIIDIVSAKYPFDERLDYLFIYNELNGCTMKFFFTTHDHSQALYNEILIPLKLFLLEVEIEYPRRISEYHYSY